MLFLAGLIPLSQEIRPGTFAKAGKVSFSALPSTNLVPNFLLEIIN